jgi:hypothetical protein
MPKSTAIWLVEHTSLTFEQIADFCGLHILEIKAIADGETDNMIGFDPIASSQLTADEIARCENDPGQKLQISPAVDVGKMIKNQRAKYTPVVKRKDKPSAILWLIRYYPNLPDSHICNFLSSTRSTVQSIRNKTHWNIRNIEPQSPVTLGFCTSDELEQLISNA